jgi:hypothetical protein
MTKGYREETGVADFVSVTLEDGTEVLFQSAESDLVRTHGGRPHVVAVETTASRLEAIAKAAQQLCESLRQELAPEELQLEIGVGLSGEVGWFFAKSSLEGSMKVTLTWKKP